MVSYINSPCSGCNNTSVKTVDINSIFNVLPFVLPRLEKDDDDGSSRKIYGTKCYLPVQNILWNKIKTILFKQFFGVTLTHFVSVFVFISILQAYVFIFA